MLSERRGRLRRPWVCAVWIMVLCAAESRGELTRFEILRRQPVANGMPFGDAGPYEMMAGKVHYALDPEHPRNQAICDLELASREADGRVHFSADFFLLAPVDRNKSNGALLYDVNNRGNKLALRFFQDAPGGNAPEKPDDFGNGFLMRRGWVVAWSGWDGELLPDETRLRLQAPVARAADGSPLTGWVRCEFVPESSETRRLVVNWAQHGSYPPTERGIATATLTVRARPEEPRRPVPRGEWQLLVTPGSEDPPQLPRVEIEMPSGMRVGHLYELIYEAQEPRVMGCGFAAVRDLVAALRHGEGENNPLVADGRSVITRAHGFGVSQSGRFLREFLYSGFNADEQGRQVFAGLMPHVAGGGLGSFNHRFAQPTRHAAQHDHDDYPADRFPFSYESQWDAYTGRWDGLLRRSVRDGVAPWIVHTQSSAEYWTRSGSLVHTDTTGRRDARPPSHVRIFAFGGTQHGPAGFPPSAGAGRNLANPGDYRPFLRALLVALDEAALDVAPLPPSVVPRIDEGTLVEPNAVACGFPDLPGVVFPTTWRRPPVLDFGPRWASQRIADRQPPLVLARYRTLVPRTDADGNDLGCLSVPEAAVPEATYTGWNVRSPQFGPGDQLISLAGSYFPLPDTRQQQAARRDPRASLEERYGSLETYEQALTEYCESLVERRYLLPEDAAAIVARQTQRLAPRFARIMK